MESLRRNAESQDAVTLFGVGFALAFVLIGVLVFAEFLRGPILRAPPPVTAAAQQSGPSVRVAAPFLIEVG